ncbi:hypothetical protein C7212DRAFT_365988 [Tuber magnatum]|uniref:GPI inositol-deacylase winged helix domain-containing protein n=1 Tax=Tuber magnatum TaxID=42249 RepID=A0A317SHN8_9PEZI|nr:hypothetical protein C7212DRAFT_365988 [Tuber magnatum]
MNAGVQPRLNLLAGWPKFNAILDQEVLQRGLVKSQANSTLKNIYHEVSKHAHGNDGLIVVQTTDFTPAELSVLIRGLLVLIPVVGDACLGTALVAGCGGSWYGANLRVVRGSYALEFDVPQSSEHMGERQSNPHSGNVSWPESSMANTSIQGHYGGNTGFGNTFGSANIRGNITITQPASWDSPPIVAEILQCLYTSRYEIVCYFLFKDDSYKQTKATFALCTILHQLFARRKKLCGYAHGAFKAKGKAFTEESLKFLVTSRPYHEIGAGLGTPATMIRRKGEDEVNSIIAAVNRVTHKGIKNLESYWGRPGGLGYLRDLLESSADDIFLCVALVLEILKESGGHSVGKLSHIVFTPPCNLPGLYSKMLDKTKNTETGQRILHILVGAMRPLSPRELNVAFRIRQNHSTIADIGDYSSGSETTLKDLCGLFVRITDSKVYLVHQTAREFLIKGPFPGKGNWQYTLCPMDSSFPLANICITYLSLEEFENPLGSVTGRSYGVQVIGDDVHKYPLLDFAASHWVGHFRDSGKRQMQLFESTRRICKPGSKGLPTLLRVYCETSG